MPSLWDDAHASTSMRLPKVRQKLSSLVRRGSSKRKQATATGPNGVTFSAPVLNVNLEPVKSLRLADGWLEDANTPPSPKRRRSRGGEDARDSEQRKSDQEKKRYSATPIADLFSMSTDQLASTLETISRKPSNPPAPSAAVPSPWTVAPPATTTTPAAAGGAAAISKPQRRDASAPAPVQQEPQPIRISLRHSTVMDTVVVPDVRSSTESRRRSVMAWSSNALVNAPNSSSTQDEVSDGASRRHSVQQVNLMRSVGPNTTGLRVSNGGGSTTPIGSGSGSGAVDDTKRNSTASISAAIEMHFSQRPPIAEIKTTLATPRNASTPTPISTAATPTSSTETRRRSWQPATPLSAVAPPAQGSMGPPPRRTTSTRPPSAALTSSRLAWIRELESKSSSSSSSSGASDIQKLGLKSSSGVAGKLAMFEHIQKQKQPSQPTLSRSNSTASSRMTDSVFAGYSAASPSLSHVDGLPSTARTSMDSTRSMPHGSQRSSAVLAYYDEEFRERMEGVAGGWKEQLDKDKNGKDSARKVTARLVEVETERTAKKEGSSGDVPAVPEVSEEKEAEPAAQEVQATIPALADVTLVSGGAEAAEAKTSEVVEPAGSGKEPVFTPVLSEEPLTVKADQVESVDENLSKDQLSKTGDAPIAVAVEEAKSTEAIETEKAEVEAAKEASFGPECHEMREVEKTDEKVDAPSQETIEQVPEKEIVSVTVCEEQQEEAKADVPVAPEQVETQGSDESSVKTQIAESATGV